MNINDILYPKPYRHHNDYLVKGVLEKRAQGVLNLAGIQCKVTSIGKQEYTRFGPKLNRVDFVCDGERGDKKLTVILECQTIEPTEGDIYRFFQYASSLFDYKHHDIELYVLCLEKVKKNIRKVTLNDESQFIIHVISLKDYKAEAMFV